MVHFPDEFPLDEVAKEMLMAVIEKKKKWERLEKRTLLLQAAAFVGLAVFFLYILAKAASFGTWGERIAWFFAAPVHVFILLLLSTVYWAGVYYKGKSEKAEDDFHALRCEIIQKSIDLWKDEEQWNGRHRLFEWMKREYDINLYYEQS
ncbi:YpbF family protein [Geobacillus thermoleovorans]|uniref:YpbF family protein n=1 Tax=Geobacillus thermoleovorans TaxID=33941 RepID=UPI00345BBE84